MRSGRLQAVADSPPDSLDPPHPPDAPDPLDPLVVVGIGADGWAGLTRAARDALTSADVILGGDRQLAMAAAHVGALRAPWPSPLLPALAGLLAKYRGRRVCVLASGDPMFFGIGSSLVRLVGAERVRVIPHPSSVSLACARLGWAVEDPEVVSLVGRPHATLQPAVQPGRRLLVLVSTPSGATVVAGLLRDRGFGASPLVVLTQLEGANETVLSATAASWSGEPHDPLAIVAVECRADTTALVLPRTPGLPDSAYETDGQLTKREVRSLTLAALAPVPGQLLWDVGAGSGSVGIEWMRTHPACRAIAIEADGDRRERVARNALALGVPGLQLVGGSVPEALTDLPTPDAVFVGGAVSVPGVVEAALSALPAGGRLVANGVTLETETTLAGWRARLGGELTRIAVQRAKPVGAFTGWRPAMPVTQWSYLKPGVEGKL
jgi:precorrin-6B C5,15-methyltransferase / cobalt-precorrin-6B C5,C15-methyltransferase